MTHYHSRFLELVDEIETTFPVALWQVGDVPVWPLARAELCFNVYWQSVGKGEDEWRAARRRKFSAHIAQAASYASTPLINVWRSRADLRRLVLWPRRAHALLLGDGVFLERVDGAWRDRLCDPLIEALERNGQSGFLMQSGNPRGQHWSRPTFAANTIDRWGRLAAVGMGLPARLKAILPDHDSVVKYLSESGFWTHGLSKGELQKSAATVAATAFGFEQVLRIVQPAICFMVKYHLGMGHALALACRRRGVLSVDLQHNRQDRHEAYRWLSPPESGYAILPAVFWNWTEEDAAAIDAWTNTMKRPWHRSVHGGHPQLAAWLDESNPQTRAFDAKIAEIRARRPAEVEILVALQNLERHADIWNALATLIESAPAHWRWWLRRHPAAMRDGDKGLGRLLAIRRHNVLIDEASSLSLPALLRRMDVVLSLYSGAAVEASLFGLKPIFLSQNARELFPGLLDSGKAEIIDDMQTLKHRIAAIRRQEKIRPVLPALAEVLAQLDTMAGDYSALCGRR